LHPSVLDVESKMVLSVFASVPPKIVNVAIKRERSTWTKGISKEFLDLSFVHIETHAIYSILKTGILFKMLVSFEIESDGYNNSPCGYRQKNRVNIRIS
jgi:hypothetical protein